MTSPLQQARSIRISRKLVPLDARQTWSWARPDASGWTEDQKHRYQRFEGAITDYLGGEKVAIIEERYSLNISQVQEQLARALARDGSGERHGFLALIPFLHIDSIQNRTKELPQGPQPSNGACKGGLMYLLQKEDLYAEFEQRVLGKCKHAKEAKVSPLVLQKWIVATLTERGYKKTEYPFTTSIPLYSSISRLVKKIKSENIEAYIKEYGDGKQATNLHVMSGSQYQNGRPMPLEEVEIDEHKLHGIAGVRITIDGIDKIIPADRAVGIAIVDRYSNPSGVPTRSTPALLTIFSSPSTSQLFLCSFTGPRVK